MGLMDWMRKHATGPREPDVYEFFSDDTINGVVDAIFAAIDQESPKPLEGHSTSLIIMTLLGMLNMEYQLLTEGHEGHEDCLLEPQVNRAFLRSRVLASARLYLSLHEAGLT